jgi:hypothetical protein
MSVPTAIVLDGVSVPASLRSARSSPPVCVVVAPSISELLYPRPDLVVIEVWVPTKRLLSEDPTAATKCEGLRPSGRHLLLLT